MWSAKIVSREVKADVVLTGVEYTDGTNTFSQSLSNMGADVDSLKAQIQAKLKSLETNDSLVASVDTLIQSKEVITKLADVVITPK